MRRKEFLLSLLEKKPALSSSVLFLFLFPSHAPLAPSPPLSFPLSPLQTDALDFLGYAILGLLSYASEFFFWRFFFLFFAFFSCRV